MTWIRKSGEIDAYGNPIVDRFDDQIQKRLRKGPNPPAYCFIGQQRHHQKILFLHLHLDL